MQKGKRNEILKNGPKKKKRRYKLGHALKRWQKLSDSLKDHDFSRFNKTFQVGLRLS